MTLKQDVFDINVVRGMVPAGSIRGAVPKSRGADINEIRGMVAVPWPSYADDPQPTICRATTKKGEPCKAAPLSDDSLCVGHARQRDAQRTDS